jgi:hypothetical protein
VWQEWFHLSSTKLPMSFAFRPQTDGQSEVTNHMIFMYLLCLVGNKPRSWLRWLPWAEYYFNTSYQTALNTTPFHVVYGRAPPDMIPFQARSAKVVAVDHQLRDKPRKKGGEKRSLPRVEALSEGFARRLGA